MDRRRFARRVGSWLVIVNGIPLIASCAGGGGDDDDDDDDDGTTPTGLTEVSTIDGAHSHSFTIPDAALTAPPASGYSDETTLNSGHTHTVTLTQSQLQQIQAGTAVTVTSSSASAHTHDFTFSLA